MSRVRGGKRAGQQVRIGTPDESLTAVSGQALTDHIERLARRAALRQLLDGWEHEYGPVSEAAAVQARAAFDELDGAADSRDAA